jgi:hypothetical protein
MATYGGENGTLWAVRLISVLREVGTAQDADLHFAVDNESKTYGILSSTKKTLGAIYGIYSPHSPSRSAFRVAPVY